jgi:protein Mpv17
MAALLRRYARFYERRPYVTSFVTCLAKGSIADAATQAWLEKRPRLDVRRTALFGLWSAAYCGCAQHYIFNVVFARVFGIGTGFGVALRKACADSFIATPLLGIPIYYSCKPLIEGTGGLSSFPMDGLREYAGIFREFYFKPAMVWIPAHLLTFSLIPQPLRIGWTATVSLGWLSFVSMTSHADHAG